MNRDYILTSANFQSTGIVPLLQERLKRNHRLYDRGFWRLTAQCLSISIFIMDIICPLAFMRVYVFRKCPNNGRIKINLKEVVIRKINVNIILTLICELIREESII